MTNIYIYISILVVCVDMEPRRRRAQVERVPTAAENADRRKRKGDDKRIVKRSCFMITLNTNTAYHDEQAAMDAADLFAQTIDDFGDEHEVGCEEWGQFFKLNIARGRQFLDKNGTKANPAYNPTYNKYYQNDRVDMKEWCSHIKSFEVKKASTEWSPGTVNGKNKYLHAHFFMTVEH